MGEKIDGESEDLAMRWYVQDGVNDEDSEQNEVDGTKKGLIPQVRWSIPKRAVGGL